MARSYSPTATVPPRPASAAVMSLVSFSASPALAEVQPTAGPAAAAGLAAATDAATIAAPAPAATAILARRDAALGFSLVLP
ncbi:hypothetical protein SZN_09963 [Streptomyces zinciresistens K42]|uniref:Secreted protein n=1 Tax=Streptomyces zinciresistens K42 TaxID=700597 RepID=G2G922_9ACTN|nr:hypothetical protein SZN_09963 [Streptomyces zinciresistens K42]